jgi:hypothetical protein
MWSRNFLSFRNILVVGQLRNFVVSHGLFLKIQGGQDYNFRPEKGSKLRPRKYSVLETSKRSEGSKGFKESKNNS